MTYGRNITFQLPDFFHEIFTKCVEIKADALCINNPTMKEHNLFATNMQQMFIQF